MSTLASIMVWIILEGGRTCSSKLEKFEEQSICERPADSRFCLLDKLHPDILPNSQLHLVRISN